MHLQTALLSTVVQLRGSVMGQVHEAEMEIQDARAQAEQDKQARWAQVQALLSDKACLEAALCHQQQASMDLQVCSAVLSCG